MAKFKDSGHTLRATVEALVSVAVGKYSLRRRRRENVVSSLSFRQASSEEQGRTTAREWKSLSSPPFLRPFKLTLPWYVCTAVDDCLGRRGGLGVVANSAVSSRRPSYLERQKSVLLRRSSVTLKVNRPDKDGKELPKLGSDALRATTAAADDGRKVCVSPLRPQ